MRTSFKSFIAFAVVAVALSGCGKEASIRTEAETEGLWVNLGPVSYQVQISRELNPADVEDRAYVEGLDPALAKTTGGETLFGIFLEAKNESGGSAENPKRTVLSADKIKIVDTQGNRFYPLPPSPQNPFAYRPTKLIPGESFPPLGSAADTSSAQGALVVFKLKQVDLQNRPLKLKLESSAVPGREVSVDIDV